MEGGTRTIVFSATGLALMIGIQVLVLFWALRCRLGRENSPHVDAGEGCDRETGLSAEEVAELPCHEVKQGDDGGECSVCLEAFGTGDTRRELPRCGHGFHAECVDSWLRNNRRCPLCRAEVVAQGKTAAAMVQAATVEIVIGR